MKVEYNKFETKKYKKVQNNLEIKLPESIEDNRQGMLLTRPSLSNVKANFLTFNGFKNIHSFKTLPTQQLNILDPISAKLAVMAKNDIPVVPGFVLTGLNNKNLSEKEMGQISGLINDIEGEIPNKLGSFENPLVLSIKTKEKVVNVGFNSEIAEKFLEHIRDEDGHKRFVYDTYSRIIKYWGTNVLDVPKAKFDNAVSIIEQKHNRTNYNELPDECIKTDIVPAFKKVIEDATGTKFPENIQDQIKIAINKLQKEDSSLVLQFNPFNHIGDKCGTAVCFSRDPKTGEKLAIDAKTGQREHTGGYLRMANGNLLISNAAPLESPLSYASVVYSNDAYKTIIDATDKSEKLFKNPQCSHFVICNGKVFTSETHDLNQAPKAKFKALVDMAKEEILNEKEVLQRVSDEDLTKALGITFDPKDRANAIKQGNLLGKGLGVSANSTSGRVVFDSSEAEIMAAKGEKVILVKSGLSNAEDVNAILSSEGIIAANAGPTSHAAVVARGSGKPCIVGLTNAKIDEREGKFSLGGTLINKGDYISIDGTTGEIYKGKLKVVSAKPSEDVFEVLNMADRNSKMSVFANAETPKDVKTALNLGAKGIGLCRTEHMFFEKNRVPIMQKAILAGDNQAEKMDALNQLEKMQYQDFIEIFKDMGQKPITVRLLDPPLDEFLPKSKELIKEITVLEIKNPDSKVLADKKKLLAQVESLEESDPMLGNRGSRLGITDPDFYKMQVRAIVKAAVDTNTRPKIMLPMISSPKEFEDLSKSLKGTIKESLKNISADEKISNEFKIGTMIEVPSAALSAGEIAEKADFCSFGTNDLTQMTLGLSRNDSHKFIGKYLESGIFASDPFKTIHSSVVKLMKMAIKDGKEAKPKLQMGVCGEHGADPESIAIFNKIGVDYISCSPNRIPNARLAAGKSNTVSFNGKIQGQKQLPANFSAFREVMVPKFKEALEFTVQNPQFTKSELMEEIQRDYSPQSISSIKLSGEKVGLNNVVLIIPGIDKEGKIPEIFPLSEKVVVKAGSDGNHWKIQRHFLTNVLDEIQSVKPDFDLKNLKDELNLKVITDANFSEGHPSLPSGVSIPTGVMGMKKLTREVGIRSGIDAEGNPNYACIHGFLVCDKDKKYIVVDDEVGIKDFVKKNQQLFNETKKRYGIEDIIVAEYSTEKNLFKEKNEFLRQVAGKYFLDGVQVSGIHGRTSNADEITTATLIERMLNPEI